MKHRLAKVTTRTKTAAQKWTKCFLFRGVKGKNKIDGTEDERWWVEKDGEC